MRRLLGFLTCSLTVAIASELPQPAAALRLPKGHELFYRGTVEEEEPGRTGLYRRSWGLEVRAIVLEVQEGQTSIATMTVLRSVQAAATVPRTKPQTASVRLELCDLDAQGRLQTGERQLGWRVIDGLSTWELGFYVEVSEEAPEPRKAWMVQEPGRPPRRYRVMGEEPVNGVMCFKVEGHQQSADWDQPRADSAAWRVREMLWLTPRTGHAQQVERILERRDPARLEAGYRLVTRYKLDDAHPYRAAFFEDRRREIQQAKGCTEKVMALLPEAGQHGPRPFETLIARINVFMEKYPETPYREALRHARRLAEAGQRNEVPPQFLAARSAALLALGKPAPDFVVTELKTGRNLTLRQWRGNALLMAFYHPRSATAAEMMRHLQDVHGNSQLGSPAVVAFVMTDDLDAAAGLMKRLSLTLPQAAGTNLRTTYEVETTPRFVLIDAEGVVVALSNGWGLETPATLEAQIKRLKSRSSGRP